MGTVILKPDREKALHRRHPWLYSGAIAKVTGEPAPGATVEVRSAEGKILGRGAWSPKSKIAVRMWSFDPNEQIDAAFFKDRLTAAVSARRPIGLVADDTAGRLVHAESDGLPGLIVDRYAGYLVCQCMAVGVEFWKETIIPILRTLVPCEGIFERSDAKSRELEGLPPYTGVLAGSAPPPLITIREGNCRYLVDVHKGHKTGFYLDQAVNRVRVAAYAPAREVLNCFAYTGAFSVAALTASATAAVSVESSGEALDLALKNMELNGIESDRALLLKGDVFEALRVYRAEKHHFDMVILDPPKFAESRDQVEKAARGYKDINLQAMHLLRPGGILATFSCSQQVGVELFERTLAFAAADAGRRVQVVEWLYQAPDHPMALNYPEGYYLKGAICRVQ
ncbi:MAG: class I SAM-dependent methyltransferase [Planctomycetota bacterium]